MDHLVLSVFLYQDIRVPADPPRHNQFPELVCQDTRGPMGLNLLGQNLDVIGPAGLNLVGLN